MLQFYFVYEQYMLRLYPDERLKKNPLCSPFRNGQFCSHPHFETGSFPLIRFLKRAHSRCPCRALPKIHLGLNSIWAPSTAHPVPYPSSPPPPSTLHSHATAVAHHPEHAAACRRAHRHHHHTRRRRKPSSARPWPWRLTPRRPPQPLPLRYAFPTLCPPRASPRRLSLGAAAAAGFGSAPAGAARVCRGGEKVALTWLASGACWAAYSAGAAATTGRPRGRSTPTPWRASTPWSPRSPPSQTPTCAHAPPHSRTVLAPGNPWIPFSPYVPKYNGHSMLSVQCVERRI